MCRSVAHSSAGMGTFQNKVKQALQLASATHNKLKRRVALQYLENHLVAGQLDRKYPGPCTPWLNLPEARYLLGKV